MWRLRHDEEGAVTTLVAILLATGVLLGFGVLVIDVGQLYAERRELQNGADAASLAVAQSCVTNSSCQIGEAQPYANGNANDSVTALDGSYGPAVCGRGPGLQFCGTTGPGGYVDCGEAPASSVNYVQVRTSTLRPGGGTLIPPALVRALPGMAGYTGAEVRACARATWGPPGGVVGLPLTISACEWNYVTSGGTNYAPPLPWTSWPSVGHEVLFFHNTNQEDVTNGCPASPANSDGPGDFGWLDSTNCSTTTTADSWSPTSTGNSPGGSGCTEEYLASLQGKVVAIPIFDVTNGQTGNNMQYHIVSYAAFYLDGYFLGSMSYRKQQLSDGQYPCTGNSRCISGWFLHELTTTPSSGGTPGPDMGAEVINLIP